MGVSAMSLITKMLNDLDKRDAPEGERPIFVDVRNAAYGRRSSRQGPVVAAVIAVVVIGVAVWVWSSSRKPAAPVALSPLAAANPAPAAPASTTVAPPAAAPAAAPAAPAAPPPLVEPAAPAAPKPAPLAKAEPVASKPAPVVAKPEPVAPKPLPVAAKPEPVAAKAEPTARAAPVVSAPAPVATKAAPPARAEPVARVEPPAAPAVPQSFKQVNTQQRSENLYREAILLVRQGQVLAAHERLRLALDAYPANHGARQMLAGLLMDSGRHQEAESLLQAGLKLGPANPDLPMALARAQVAGGKNSEALATLEQGLANAGDAPDYHAFYAALLQKQGRHDQAVNHYITALRSDPMQPNWLIGVGISLRATNRLNDAAEAFQRAIASGELTPQVAEFASQQLSQIGARR